MNIFIAFLTTCLLVLPVASKDEENKMTTLAFLALKKADVAKAEDFKASLAKVYGKEPDIKNLSVSDTTITFNHKGNFCMLGLIDKPIPWGDLEGPCATAWWWKEAEKEMKAHRAHFIATVIGEKGNALEQTVDLTKYIAAAADCHEASGIYWGNGTLVHEPSKFIDSAKKITPKDFSTNLWVDIRFWKTDDGKATFVTTGLEAFDKMEVEVVGSAKDFDDIYNLVSGAAYLQIAGSTFKDGDTIGADEKTKIKTSHEKSIWDRPEKVLRLHF